MIEPPAAAQSEAAATSSPPDPWPAEDLGAFRESFLQWVTPPTVHKILRELGEKFAELIREQAPHWPLELGSAVAWEVRAGLGDLRQVQGFLARVGDEWKVCHLEPADLLLSQAVAVEARALAACAGRLEALLTSHRAEAALRARGEAGDFREPAAG